MQIRIFENRHVYIKIRDKGCGIADIEQAMQPLFTTAPEEERAGLGFAVMESFMDKVKVRSKLGEGTTLILEKTLKERVETPLAEENLGLVHLCANRFRNRGIEYDDLYGAGCIGLVKAAKAFDSDRGVKFSTYAVPVILGEIKRLFRDGGTIKVSRSIKELSMRLVRERERFSIPDIEIADRLSLRQVIASLEAEDRKLIYLRYFQNKTQMETAKQLGMSQVQVSRREKKLLTLMREQLK